MKCYIYHSINKQGHYIYLKQKDHFERIPKPVLKPLGKLEYCFELDLETTRKLAQEDINQVKENLVNQGFHLQIPPRQKDLLSEFKEKRQ